MVAQQSNRLNDQFKDAMQHMQNPTELVKEYPLSSMLLMFGVGIGVGVIVGQTLCSTLMELVEEPTMTEKVKKQVYDAVSQVIPPSMMRQISSFTHQ